MATVIMTVVAVSIFLYWHNDQQRRQDFIRNNLVLVKLVGEFTILPLVFDDSEGAKQHINTLLQDSNLSYVRLKNAENRIMVDYDPVHMAEGAPVFIDSQEYSWLPDQLYFRIAIHRNNRYLGELSGAFRLDEFKRVQYSELVFIIAAVLAAMTCSLIMALLLRQFVMASIQQLENHARRIAKDPGLDESIAYPQRQNDEISHLYEAFNLLMKQVRTREAEIMQLNASLESKIKQRTADLSAALKVKSAFLANMSHEIRTPMNAILGMHHLILETELTPKQHNYLTKANNAAKWLLGIINDVLDVSKLEAGKLTLETINFKLEAIIQYLEDVARPLLKEKPVTLQFSIDAAIPKTLVGDQLRIGQVLLNLLSNAIKFTEFGTITVNIQLLYATTDRVMLRFSVTDTGIGISEDQRQNLFQAFSQADSSTTRRYGGTGLGLVICKDLVEAMGGDITIHSQLGSGSCFSFNLELGVSKQNSPDLQIMPQTLAINAQIFKGRPLLLVEDNQVNQELMLEILSKYGLRVDLACNGAEAISMVEKNPYDAVLMDCQMPVMDGFIATRILRDNPRFVDLPIIAMTANVMAEDRERCLASGMNDHVGKPIDWQQLFQMLEYWIGRKSSTPLLTTHSSPAKSSAVDALPPIAGVDADRALNIVSGSIPLYRKLLALVRSKHLNGMTIIKSAYQAGDYQAAALQAHTLSGTLSSIGAMQLSGLLKTLQDKFDKGNTDETLQSLLAQAESEFNQLMQEIDPICQSPAADTSSNKAASRILLIENNESDQWVSASILEKSGFEVVIANNGKQALSVLVAQRFAAVLMDIHMPVMDGLEATRQMRLLPEGKDIPILALTAAASQQDIQEVYAAGMNAHIAKPIEPKQLLELLAQWINPGAGRQSMPNAEMTPAKIDSRSWPGRNAAEILAQLEQIALALDAHEAISQSRLSAICEMIDSQFSQSRSKKIAQLIEQYDYANAFAEIQGLISQLREHHVS